MGTDPEKGYSTAHYYGLLDGKGKVNIVMAVGGGTGRVIRSDSYVTSSPASSTYARRKQQQGSDGQYTSWLSNDKGSVTAVMLPKSNSQSVYDPNSPHHIGINYEANGVDVDKVQRSLDGELLTLVDVDYYQGTRDMKTVTRAVAKTGATVHTQKTTYIWHTNGLIQSVTDGATSDVTTFEYDQGANEDGDSYTTWRLLRVR
jgi:hypothetical protein